MADSEAISEVIDDYSEITDIYQTSFIFGCYVIGSAGFVVAVTAFISLLNIDFEAIHAKRLALTSFLCSMFVYFFQIFIFNDLIIPWQIINDTKTDNTMNAFMLSCVGNLFYIIGKIMFYYSFALHIQLLYTKKKQTHKTTFFLKISMIIVGIIYSASFVYYIASFLGNPSANIIGIGSKMVIFPVLYAGNGYYEYLMIKYFAEFAFDLFYGIVLMYYYIGIMRKFKYDYTVQHQGVKGLTLIVLSSLIYWMLLLIQYYTVYIWVFINIEIMVSDICLYLMFEENIKKSFYFRFCRICDCCCGFCCFGRKFNQIRNQQPDDDDPDSAHLIPDEDN